MFYADALINNVPIHGFVEYLDCEAQGPTAEAVTIENITDKAIKKWKGE